MREKFVHRTFVALLQNHSWSDMKHSVERQKMDETCIVLFRPASNPLSLPPIALFGDCHKQVNQYILQSSWTWLLVAPLRIQTKLVFLQPWRTPTAWQASYFTSLAAAEKLTELIIIVKVPLSNINNSPTQQVSVDRKIFIPSFKPNCVITFLSFMPPLEGIVLLVARRSGTDGDC